MASDSPENLKELFIEIAAATTTLVLLPALLVIRVFDPDGPDKIFSYLIGRKR